MRKPKKPSKLGTFKEVELRDDRDATGRCMDVCEKINELLQTKPGMCFDNVVDRSNYKNVYAAYILCWRFPGEPQ